MAAEENPTPQNIATAIAEISERASLLIREEIELAKAEVTTKLRRLVKGAIVAAAGGIFLVTALLFALHGLAWLAWFEWFGPQGNFFWGFFILAGVLLLLALIAGLIALRAVRRGAPPTPTMAIEEAQKIRDVVSSGETVSPGEVQS